MNGVAIDGAAIDAANAANLTPAVQATVAVILGSPEGLALAGGPSTLSVTGQQEGAGLFGQSELVSLTGQSEGLAL